MVRSLADALREFDDERLEALFDARRDLTREAPAGITALAGRAAQLGSVHRALASLRRPELQLAEAIAAHNRPLSPDELAHSVSATTEHIASHVYRLATLGLVYADQAGQLLVPVRTLAEAIPHPAGLAPILASDPSADKARAIVSGLSSDLRQVAEQLAWAPARISGSPTSPLAKSLVKAGLANVISTQEGQRLIVPRPVHVALRDGVIHRDFARVPTISEAAATEMYPGARDAQAVEAALEADRIFLSLAHWHTDPPQVLKRGGVPVRDMRRLAAATGTDLTAWATVVHAAWVASLVGHDGESWQVTRDFSEASDAPASRRWADLTVAWARANYLGSVAGTRLGSVGLAGAAPPGSSPADAARPQSGQSPSLVDSSEPIRGGLSSAVGREGAKTRRRYLLCLLSDSPESRASVDDLAGCLAWAFPTLSARVVREEAWAFATEAEALGLLVDGTATSLGHALAATTDLSAAEAIDALTDALNSHLPDPVDSVIVDADLTVTVPGVPSARVSRALAWTDVVSRGAGTTAVISEKSIARAIDAGEDADSLLAQFAEVSLTPLPQPLEFLIRDVARRRGQVHVRPANTIISGEAGHLDRLLAAPEAAKLHLHRIAPTVVVSQSDPSFVMGQVRLAGLSPLVTAADGQLVTDAPRATLRGGPLPLELESDLTDTQLTISAADAVARIRRADSGTDMHLSMTQRLLSALAQGEAITMGVVDGRGGTQVLNAVPLSLEGGRLRAREVDGAEFTVLIHRVVLP